MKFRIGDIVQIRSWESMEKEFGISGGSINCKCRFVSSMEPYCNKTAKVSEKYDTYYRLKLLDNNEEIGWNFSDDMLTVPNSDESNW